MKNRMKPIALLLSLLLVLALFSGCNSGGGTPATQAPATQAPATQAPATQAPATKAPATQAPATEAPATEEPVDEGPYHFAKGYATDADGWPLEKWVYDRPITDADDVFTRYTTVYYAQYLPEEGYGSIEIWQDVAEYTGVHIEYDVIDPSSRSQNFAVRLASDELDDIIDQGSSLYSGTLDQAVDEGYFADVYNLRHLMPCFMWEIKNRSLTNSDVLSSMFYKKTHLIVLYGLVMNPVPSTGYAVRGDWLDDLGLGSSLDIDTFDEAYKVCTAFKVNETNNAYNKGDVWPFLIYSMGESTPGYAFAGYNTALYLTSISYTRVVDGEVQFCGTTEDDRDLMTMLNKWYAEGLISPNFQAFNMGGTEATGERTDNVGLETLTPGVVTTLEAESLNPNARWDPVPRLRRFEGQTLEYGNKRSEGHYGSACLSAKCENLELLCSYMDWWMSDFGGDFTSWGPEGVCWEYNEQGERQLTEWVNTHPAGAMWIMLIYTNNNMVEFCLHDVSRSYAYPGGEKQWAFYDVWRVKDYGGAYDWPKGVILTDDQTEEAASIRADLNTFFAENYTSFITNAKPMSEWDSFQSEMNTFGMDRLTAIYQAAYDAYMADL